MHVRADILEAFEQAIDAVPIVAAVYTHPAILNPPSGKVMVELALAEEGPNKRIGGDWPNEVVMQRPLVVAARVEAAVPRDMDAKEFERSVLAPVEVAIANCQPLIAIAEDVMISRVQWSPAQDSAIHSIEAILEWQLTYSTAAGAPGKALLL